MSIIIFNEILYIRNSVFARDRMKEYILNSASCPVIVRRPYRIRSNSGSLSKGLGTRPLCLLENYGYRILCSLSRENYVPGSLLNVLSYQYLYIYCSFTILYLCDTKLKYCSNYCNSFFISSCEIIKAVIIIYLGIIENQNSKDGKV